MQDRLANDRLDHIDRRSTASRNLRHRKSNQEIKKHVDLLGFYGAGRHMARLVAVGVRDLLRRCSR